MRTKHSSLANLYGGVVLLGGNGKLPVSVRFRVQFRTQALFSTPYSPYQSDLSDKVIELRDKSRLPYWQIAAVLTGQGYRGARGAALDAKGAFSVYKKRKRRDARLTKPIAPSIPYIEVTYEP